MSKRSRINAIKREIWPELFAWHAAARGLIENEIAARAQLLKLIDQLLEARRDKRP